MNEINVTIREASRADLPELQTVLTQVQLSIADLLADGTRYWLAENADGQPVGVIGLEIGQTSAYLFSTDAGTYWQRLKFREVPVSEVVAVLPDAPQVKQYEMLGCLSTEVARRRDLLDE